MKTKLNSLSLLICVMTLALGAPLSLRAAAFSDANWMSMAGFPARTVGSRGGVDSAGNLYIGGNFTIVCDVVAIQSATPSLFLKDFCAPYESVRG